jgi:uncharacterized membrane protein required for colicin V production
MTQAELNITITEGWFVALVAVAFAYFTLRRGLTIGLYMLAATVAGIAFADRLAQSTKSWINVTYQMIRAMIRTQAFSPEVLLKVALEEPKLITENIHTLWLGTLIFLLIVLLGYLIGRKRKAKAKQPRLTTRILATLVGAVNGYLIMFFLFPRHVTASKTVITMPNVNVRDLLRIQLGLPLLVMILVVITLGVLGAREGRAKSK